MSPEFYHQIFKTQQKTEVVPPNEQIANWALNLIRLLYPERSETIFKSPAEIEQAFKQLESELTGLLNATKDCCDDDNTEKAQTFFEMIPELYRVLNTDIDAIVLGDPAAHTRFEVIRAYPGSGPGCLLRRRTERPGTQDRKSSTSTRFRRSAGRLRRRHGDPGRNLTGPEYRRRCPSCKR